MLIDTHTHLYLEEFNDDRSATVQRALDHGIKKLLLPNIDNSTVEAMLELEQTFPDNCFPMMGLHPCSVNAGFREDLRSVEKWFELRRFVAVGEVGTDLYWDKTWAREQIECFKWHLEFAKQVKLPLVIHSRDTLDLNIGLVEELQDGRLTGVFHCFNGDMEQAARIGELGFYMGIGGVVTFKNAGVDKVVAQLPLDRIVLETDAPYLTPVPHRGKRNESAYLIYVAEKIAEVQSVDLETVIKRTTDNAMSVFLSLDASN